MLMPSTGLPISRADQKVTINKGVVDMALQPAVSCPLMY